MKGDDERTLGGGLGAGIFVMPLVFGWLVMRRGYHPGVRIAVGTYMLLSLIPLYFLVSILWNSGDDVKRLARDYDRNRSVAEDNAGRAESYMRQYEDGDLQETGSGNGVSPAESSDAPLRITARALVAQIEKDGAAVQRMAGRRVEISGTTMGPAQGNRLFLEGNELYPAVILEYAGTPPGEGEVRASCASVRHESSGPVLGGCQ